jgi:hypothetical protein
MLRESQSHEALQVILNACGAAHALSVKGLWGWNALAYGLHVTRREAWKREEPLLIDTMLVVLRPW